MIQTSGRQRRQIKKRTMFSSVSDVIIHMNMMMKNEDEQECGIIGTIHNWLLHISFLWICHKMQFYVVQQLWFYPQPKSRQVQKIYFTFFFLQGWNRWLTEEVYFKSSTKLCKLWKSYFSDDLRWSEICVSFCPSFMFHLWTQMTRPALKRTLYVTLHVNINSIVLLSFIECFITSAQRVKVILSKG